MIVLDSNVTSALMQPHQNGSVRTWLDRQPQATLWTTSVSVLEIRGGLLLLPEGRRRGALMAAFDRMLVELFVGRILPFDHEAAENSARIQADRIRRGINKETRDTQIAGIVMSRRATLATRNVRDFQDLDIPLVDPWIA
ncbi:MAG: type II toxin-antitoxin system VapC family toxin [Rhizobiales bacterium]|jgi:predicted nucleic acid-binding protein|nr:type II toxin-antitoxin system VapC family toxin [Hyphomicrobiales bacterium]OJU32707.1 MAG: VapC toxin family PIN domain ribonuclease [Rhizobiales bacterium 68-8]